MPDETPGNRTAPNLPEAVKEGKYSSYFVRCNIYVAMHNNHMYIEVTFNLSIDPSRLMRPRRTPSQHQGLENMTKSNKMPEFEIPATVRDMAEKSIAQAETAYGDFQVAAQEAVEKLDKSTAAVKEGSADYGQQAAAFVQTNINDGFAFVRQLVGAKNAGEFLQIQTDYVQKQASALSDQTRTLAELSQKVAEQVSQPIKESVEASVEQMKSTLKQ